MTRSPGNFLSFTTVLALGLAPLHAHADGTDGLSVYGSLRTQVESVAPDRSGSFDRYEALRDAYSRFGIHAAHSVNQQLTLFGQVEMPLDTANLRVRDPYDQGGAGRSNGERFRLALLGARSPLGTLSYGQQWMPYYNAIAAPVDMFSSYYSGFATYTVFRVRQTLAYVSPELHGLSFAFAHADRDGNRRSTSRIDDERIQASATYVFNDTRIALGMDDRGDAGYGRNRLYGLALSQRPGRPLSRRQIRNLRHRHQGSRQLRPRRQRGDQPLRQLHDRERTPSRRCWRRSTTMARTSSISASITNIPTA